MPDATGTLLEADAHADPLVQFRRWFDEACAAALPDPNAMHLATVDEHGHPAGRVVLLKTADQRGFVFYTNYNSRKARELTAHPHAALTFFWPTFARQVRVEGTITRVGDAESDAYFHTRPRESQIGAWVSYQSEVATDRATIDARTDKVTAEFVGREVPRPSHWGGFLVAPEVIEFWQGRLGRLHDRLVYRRNLAGWTRERLWP